MTTNQATKANGAHPLQAAADVSRLDRDSSLDALHLLEVALAEPTPNRHDRWIDNTRQALEALRDALDHQANVDSETGSLLSEIATSEPRFVPRIQRLRRQHDQLRTAVDGTLVELNIQAENEHLDVPDIRSRVAELARQLRYHRAQETDLIYEAVNLNLGAGD